MTLRYTLTEADYLAFNLHHYDTSPANRAAVRSLRLAAPGLLVLLGILLSGGRAGPYLYLMLALAVLWVWFLPWYVRGSVARGIRRQIRAGRYGDLLGEHELVIGNAGIHRRDPGGEADYPWSAVQELRADTGHFYVYVDTMTAMIIPFGAFSDEQQRQAFEGLVGAAVSGAGPAMP